MGVLGIILSGVAALLLYKANHLSLCALAAIAMAGCIISFWVIHRHATRLAKRRDACTGGLFDFTEDEACSVPNWITWIFVAFGMMGLVLLVVGVVLNLLHPSPWSYWLVFVALYPILFYLWGQVHAATLWLDRYSKWMNPIGRPLLSTIVLTGLPALYARQFNLSASWLLIPVTFFATQYAVLAGRFDLRAFKTAGWVLVAATATIWILFYAL